jgi:O-antigen ligase
MQVTAYEFSGDPPDEAGSRLWHASLYLLLCLVFVAGGSSQARGWTDAMTQLLALPVLLVAAWRVVALPVSRVRSLGLVAIAAVALLPWLQLLPLSHFLWGLAPARAGLGLDLAAAGVAGQASTWTLTPAATLRGALSLLPGLALLTGVLSVDAPTQRRLLGLCVLLPIASLVLGFLQMGAAQDSLLNPYPEWAPAMGGVFANPNHQGTAMLVGLGICLAFVIGSFRSGRPGARGNLWPAAIAGGTLLLGLPLANSRAAVLIGILLLAGAPLAMAMPARQEGRGWRRILLLVVAAILMALALSAAMGWMKVDELSELRGVIRRATVGMAARQLPWGSGIASFVPVFQQAMPETLLMPAYVNAAHNDYAQFWLETGIPGLLVAGLVAWAGIRAVSAGLQGHAQDRRLVWSGVLGLAVVLVHSIVDYPLRTPALMAVAALLAGIVLAQGARDQL